MKIYFHGIISVFLNEMRKDKKINIIKTIDIFNQNNKKI